jgi:hypothetical protein
MLLMKEKDIYIDYKTHEIILYAEKEDESYAPVVCGSYAAKHHLDEFFRMKENLEKTLRQDLLDGKISPVYYFMLMQDMGPGDLAKRVGISQRKLNKHFRPDVFIKLNDITLQKYAVVFGISIDKLKETNIS